MELSSLEGLCYLGLSFNRFSSVPPVLEKLRGVEKLCLAGNQLSVLDLSGLQWLPARSVDLRWKMLAVDKNVSQDAAGITYFCPSG